MITERRKLRGLWVAVALLAVALKVLAPPGFMVAPAHSALPIVICTGHGPVQLDGKPMPAKLSDRSCAYAGNGLAPPLAGIPSLAVTPIAYRHLVTSAAPSLSPGAGLAAPPPPSQGPPILL